METIYKKTDNPDVVKKITTTEADVSIKRIETEVNNLQAEIDGMPKPKTKPDQETLDYYNEAQSFGDRDRVETEIEEKKKLLEKLKNVNS